MVCGRMNGQSFNSSIGFRSMSCPVQTGRCLHSKAQPRPNPCRSAAWWTRPSVWLGLKEQCMGMRTKFEHRTEQNHACSIVTAKKRFEDVLGSFSAEAIQPNTCLKHFVSTILCCPVSLPRTSPISQACFTVEPPLPMPLANLRMCSYYAIMIHLF